MEYCLTNPATTTQSEFPIMMNYVYIYVYIYIHTHVLNPFGRSFHNKVLSQRQKLFQDLFCGWGNIVWKTTTNRPIRGVLVVVVQLVFFTTRNSQNAEDTNVVPIPTVGKKTTKTAVTSAADR